MLPLKVRKRLTLLKSNYKESKMKKNKDALGKILDFKAVRLHGMKKKKSVKTPKLPKINFAF